jgi:hypothetical protein
LLLSLHRRLLSFLFRFVGLPLPALLPSFDQRNPPYTDFLGRYIIPASYTNPPTHTSHWAGSPRKKISARTSRDHDPSLPTRRIYPSHNYNRVPRRRVINLTIISRPLANRLSVRLYILKKSSASPPRILRRRQRQRFETSKEQRQHHTHPSKRSVATATILGSRLLRLPRFDIFAKLLAPAHRSSKAPLRSAGTAGEARNIAFGSTILLDSSSNSG